LPKPTILIYRDLLLPPSEPFVRAQAEALQHFEVVYIGLRIVDGVTLPPQQSIVVNQGSVGGKFSERIFQTVGVAPRFFRKVRQRNPHLIHAHFGVGGSVALPLAHSLNIPLIVTFHGFDATVSDFSAFRSLGYFVYVCRRNTLMREGSLFIAVSQFIKRKLLERHYPPEKVIVHYIGVDVEKFKPDSSCQREPYVLFVGRLTEKKGCGYLLRAMAEVQKEKPEVELVIIGDGPLRSSLEKLASSLLNRYRFLGTQDQENIVNWMRRAMVFSVPSITARSGDAEGFGLVFAEAQATGLPVASFASGGVPEAVAHGETGFLAAERDVSGLASYILLLLKNDTLWNHFSENGQRRTRLLFNLHRQARLLDNIYGEVLLEFRREKNKGEISCWYENHNRGLSS